jgi:hypothetical protein
MHLMSRAVSSAVGMLLIANAASACANLNPAQEAGWAAFHECQQQAWSATLEDLREDGRINYFTQEGREFSVMKACVEQRGYRCDLGVTIGFRPYTHCYPKAG